jgi:FMN phosphatase YigB (HAD superfamily)
MERDRGILFDLFGTLVLPDADRLPQLRIGDASVRSTLPELAGMLARYAPGVDLVRFWHALAAVSEEASRHRFRRALARVGCDQRACEEGGAALARAHHRTLGAATVLPPAHVALLDELRHTHRIAVVSNFDDTGGAYDILHRHGILARIDAVVVSESLGVRKPHPLIVETALHLLDLPPEAALLVGDSFGEDVGAAHAAGVDAAWIDHPGAGVPAGARPPRFVLRALPELRAVLDQRAAS